MNATETTGTIVGMLISLLLSAGFYVWIALALSAVFRKSGVEGWKAWVPVLNSAVILQLGGFSPWLVLLMFVPLANLALVVIFVIALYRVNVAFGLGIGMTILGVVALPVWASIVGWGSARWVGREVGTGVRRSGEASAELPPLPSFPTPVSRTGGPVVFPPPAPAPAGAGGFAQPPAYTPPAPAAAGIAGAAGPVAQTPAPADPLSFAPAAPSAAPTHGGQDAAATAPPAAPVAGLDVAPPPGGWTPPPLPGRPVSAAAPTAEPAEDAAAAWQGFVLDSTDHSAEVTGAVTGAPAPISAVPAAAATPAPAVAPAPVVSAPPVTASAAPAAADADDTEADDTEADDTEADDAAADAEILRPPVTRVPAAAQPAEADDEPWAPRRSSMTEADAFPEASGPVSAIAGAPDAGAPRSARSSVSAFHAKPEIPEEQDVLEETIIARRKRTDWTLVPPAGDPVALTGDVVILGRRPSYDPGFPAAQLISIQDGTVSKTHARLELRDERWYITDLDSTNGVLFSTVLGTEVEAPSGEQVEAGDRFLLGDAEVRLQRSDG